MSAIKPRIFKGARDFLPEQMMVRERIMDTMRRVFRIYGFAPLETPAIEYLNVLAGKYGEDADRLIYKLNYKTGSKDEAALHYDLTVPFSRVMAMNPQLPLPFKRYQMQPVWRADRPQPKQGRFREFYQCDIDIVGSTSQISDAEILAVQHDVLKLLGFENFIIKLNSRKILNGVVEYCGLDSSHTQEVCRSIDKLDKMPMDDVGTELREKGYDETTINALRNVMSHSGHDKLDELIDLMSDVAIAQEGFADIKAILKTLEAFGIDMSRVRFEISLARGLDYYTGAIYETKLPDHPHMGSLTGGGRYDELIGMFSGREAPAVGCSLGLDRIFTAMQQLDMMGEVKHTPTQVLIGSFGDDHEQLIPILAKLRQANIHTELYTAKAKLKKQFTYADKLGIRYMLLQGDQEREAKSVNIKDMKDGSQTLVNVAELVQWFEGKF